MKYLVLFITLIISQSVNSQGFISSLGEDEISFLMNKPCRAELASGEIIEGKFAGASIVSGYLNKVNIKNEEGEKIKLKPEEVVRFAVKPGTFAKLSMASESASSIKELTNADFNEIVNREYIIFETAMRHNKKGKLRLMQLLNPGFDDKIKVFVDPNANESMGIGVGGMKLTGGEDKSYLFVINNEKAVKVKKGKYKKSFDELYGKCPTMVESFAGEKAKWKDVAGHVFVYDQMCE